MKTKNNLTTGILIGIGIIVIPLIIMSSKPISLNTENEVGRYQVTTDFRELGSLNSHVLETIIDTKTGEVISRKKVNMKKYKKK